MAEPRIHRVTHPTFGVVSWEELKERLEPLRHNGARVCSWCLAPISDRRFRTICAQFACVDAVGRACYWSKTRMAVLRRDRKRCRLCGSSRGSEVDHIVPVALGGTGDLWNLRTLCRPCHAGETARLRAEGEGFLARQTEDGE